MRNTFRMFLCSALGVGACLGMLTTKIVWAAGGTCEVLEDKLCVEPQLCPACISVDTVEIVPVAVKKCETKDDRNGFMKCRADESAPLRLCYYQNKCLITNVRCPQPDNDKFRFVTVEEAPGKSFPDKGSGDCTVN